MNRDYFNAGWGCLSQVYWGVIIGLTISLAITAWKLFT